MDDFVKRYSAAPAGFFRAEADGLAWLAEPDVIPVVRALGHDDHSVRLEKLKEQRPVLAETARTFGERLARLHDAGAPAFGWVPSLTAWFGPLDDPFEVATTPREDFTEYWLQDRLRPLADRTSDQFGTRSYATVDEALQAIGTGIFAGVAGQGVERPVRAHGDLWSGNIMWTEAGGTLIDPAAHGGHRLEDLAMLSLFGAPKIEDIYAGYESVHPLPEGWRDDLPAHLFFGLLAHVAIFGGGYAAQAVKIARLVSDRARTLGA
jgi:fructosamine-3-kinase